MNPIETAIDIFSVLGESPKDFTNNNFKFYLVPNWETPSFSPIVLLPGSNINQVSLEGIEAYFKRHPIKNLAIKNVPYFNFIKGKGLYNVKKIKALCQKLGWIIDPIPLRVNLLLKQIPLDLPKGFNYVVYNSYDQGIPEVYKDVLKSNFNADDDYLKNVESVYKNESIQSYTTLVKDHNGRCIGGGTVSIRNGFGFLNWGSVIEAYRNMGFHQVLLAICKSIATSYDIKVCGYTTRNKFILNKCDKSVAMYICRKDYRNG